MADGNLVFNTKIDDTGVNKGTDKISSKMVDLKYKISATEREVAKLTKDLEKLGSTKIKSKAVEDLERKVVKAKDKVNSLYSEADKIGNAKQAEFESMGFDPNTKHFDDVLARDDNWQKIQQQISDAEAELSKYERELKNVQATENGISGKDTAEYAEKKNKIADLNSKLNVYKAKLNEIQSEETETSKKTANLKEHFNKLGKALKTVASRLKKAFSKTVGNTIKNIAGHTKKTNTQMNALQKSLNRIKQAFAGMLLYKVMEGILKSFKEGIDNLAKSCPTVNKSLSAFISSLAYLKNSLASAFAPIINIVTPILTGFMDTLSAVTNKVGHFIATLAGQSTYTKAIKVQKDYAESLDESAKATENLESTTNNLASFDELNVMQQDKSNNSDEESAENLFQSVPTVFSSFAERLKQAFSKGDFNGIGELVSDKINQAMSNIKWSKIRTTAKNWASNIANFLNGAISKLDWFLTGTTIGNGIMTAVDFACTFFANFDFVNLGTGLANSINGVIKSIDWNKLGETLGLIIQSVFTVGISFAQNFDWKSLWSGIVNAFTVALQSISNFFGLKGVNTKALKGALENLIEPISKIYESVKEVLKTAVKLLEPIINNLLPVLIELIGSVLDGISPIIDTLKPIADILISLISSVVKTLSPVISKIGKVITKIGEVISKVVKALTPIIKPIADLISNIVNLLAPVLDGILTIVGGIADFAGGCVDVVGQMIGELVGGNEPTISAKLQEELDNLSQISTDLGTVNNNINTAVQNVESSLDTTAGDLQYITDLKDRMVELLSESTLTDDEMAELNTIADLISDKYPEFETTWNDMTKVDSDGKLTFTKNKDEMINSIEDVISKLKEQYATEALQEQYKELYTQQIEANKKVKSALDEVANAQTKYNEKANARLEAEQALQDILSQGADYEGDLMEAQNKAIEAVENATKEEEEYKQKLQSTQAVLLRATANQEKLEVEMDKVAGITDVVTGNFDKNKDSLDKLRDAYDEGFINEDELEKQFQITSEELYKNSKSMADRTTEGYLAGIDNGVDKLAESGVTVGDNVIKGIKFILGIHSPSKATEELAGYTIEGFTNTVDEDKSTESSVKRWMLRVVDTMKKTVSNIDFSSIISTLWNPVKNLLNNILSNFENFFNNINLGLNSVINNLNSVSKITGKFTGVAYTVYPNFADIKIPKLATGAYVPANYGEFLAVLGDNKREAEIVSPISAMKQAFKEALAEGNIGGGDVHNVIYLDGDPIFDSIVKRNNEEIKRSGRSPLTK